MAASGHLPLTLASAVALAVAVAAPGVADALELGLKPSIDAPRSEPFRTGSADPALRPRLDDGLRLGSDDGRPAKPVRPAGLTAPPHVPVAAPAATPAAVVQPVAAPAPPPAPAPTVRSRTPEPPGGVVIVVDQDIRGLVGDFARRLGLRAEVSAGVRGRVSRARLPLEPEAFFAELATHAPIDWYLEGDKLFVFGRNETTTRILPLKSTDEATLRRQLTAAGVDLGRVSWRRLDEANAITVTAPPAFVAKVSAIIDSLSDTRSGTVRMIRYGVDTKPEAARRAAGK